MRIALTGAAGLIGQNLIARLKRRGGYEIVAIDKHPANTRILRELHPEITVIEADMADRGPWTNAFEDVEAIVVAHAQIGGLIETEFTRNNIDATRHLLEAIKDRKECRLVHISSSVVNSSAVDWYTETKKQQEAMVVAAGHPTLVLRPTLMFGWFDRKHLGWLARFMRRAPIFPIPGDGHFIRQPLYAGDFCEIIVAALEQRLSSGAYNISGLEHISYIDLIRLVREAADAKSSVVKIPYGLFWLLLSTYALVNRNPPFTTKQLKALVTPETFEVIDWPGIFDVPATSLHDAMFETFRDVSYASVTLEF